VDRDPVGGRQHPAGVHRVFAAARRQVIDRPPVGAGDVDPAELRRDPAAGLVEVRHLGLAGLPAGMVEEPCNRVAGLETGAPKQSAIASAARSTGRCCRPNRLAPTAATPGQ